MNVEEFLQKKVEPDTTETSAAPGVEAAPEVPIAAVTAPEELDVQKAVVESFAAEKVEMDEKIAAKEAELSQAKREIAKARAEIASLKSEIGNLQTQLATMQAKELDLQERNPNALALLDRDIDIPDRFPGETRDHVLEVVREARDKAETDGRLRRAQVLEGILLVNEPNGTLAKKRAAFEKLLTENSNIINGTVLAELKKLGISHKNGDEYLLPSEIMKRTY